MWRKRLALAVAAAFAFGNASVAAGAAAPADHDRALASLADIRAAIGEIVRIEDGDAVGPGAYQRAAHRALNALVGRRDSGYVAAAGDPGDRIGALGHLDALLDRNAVETWTPAIQGAKINLLAAAQNVQDALGEKQMEDYQGDLTQALANLALVVGRPAVTGVLGGIDGALANTVLAVPANGVAVPGCAPPARAPSYGVVRGRLAYVALPRTASGTLPAELSVGRVVVTPAAVVLYTRADDTASLCRTASHRLQRTASHRLQRTRERVRTRAVAAAAHAGAAAPYTSAQARAGAKVYATSCLSCHGANLQGTAAPGVAGKEFLSTVRKNGWSLEDLRTLVFENMPLSDPGSLPPAQYASVMAFLLASNCYPAGSKPFPAKDDPSFAKLKLGPVAGAKPANAQLGTCGVK
jgi:polar amino acid transport system substrate-binding protein